MPIRAKKLTVDDVEALLVAEGFTEVTADDMRTADYREETRSNLRILAFDDTRMPVPDEEAVLDKECGPLSSQLPGMIGDPWGKG